MALSETSLCNMSLARIGSKRINDLSADSTPEAIWCRTFYEQTRDALLRSHWWRFASARATLSVSSVTPASEWAYQYPLPADFLRMKSIYEDRMSDQNLDSYALEGNMLLSNESSMSIRYIKKVTDPTQFDALFVEVLVLQLALKLIPAIAGTESTPLQQAVMQDLAVVMRQARTIDAQERNAAGQYESVTWNDSRY